VADVDLVMAVINRFLVVLVGTLTDLGEFFYSLVWGRRQRRFIRQVLSKSEPLEGRRVIASLTTLPDRIDNLAPTIRSLLEQTRPPDEIVVAVPKFSIRQQREYKISDYLLQIPEVRILRCDKDWGPATKFIPIIQEKLAAGRGETLIMVVDDDRIYPRDALEIFLHYHKQMPNTALCFRGALIPRNLVWFLPKIFRASQIREVKRVAVITGTASYLIQPRFFDSALWDYSNVPSSAFYVDDIWISAHLDRRSVEKYVVPASQMMRSVREQSGTMTLYHVPKGSVRSNTELIRFFRGTWKVFS
jgi:Glycosyl transferase family 2